MVDANFINQALQLQDLPVYKSDIPHIKTVLNTMNQAENSLQVFPDLNEEMPITIVDKELMT